jgi:hypothetical protein
VTLYDDVYAALRAAEVRFVVVGGDLLWST